MSNQSRHLHLTTLAIALALATGSAWAQNGRGHGERGERSNRGDSGEQNARDEARVPSLRPQLPPARGQHEDGLAESVRRVERSTRGQVLSAERMQSDGRDINRIKVIDDRGRVRVYMDDPQQRRKTSTRDDDK